MEIMKQFEDVEWKKEDFTRFERIDSYAGTAFDFEFCGSVADWIIEVANEMREKT